MRQMDEGSLEDGGIITICTLWYIVLGNRIKISYMLFLNIRKKKAMKNRNKSNYNNNSKTELKDIQCLA